MSFKNFRRGLFLGALLIFGGIASPGRAELNVNLTIAAPPPIVVSAPPSMVFLPQAGVYVAVGVPYDVFYSGGRYYYYANNHWFWSPYYNGPWVVTTSSALPPGLARRQIVELRTIREQEFKVFKTKRAKVKFFVPQGKGKKNKNKRD